MSSKEDPLKAIYSQINRDFDRVLGRMDAYLRAPDAHDMRDLRQVVDQFLTSWSPLVADDVALAEKIHAFSAAIDIIDVEIEKGAAEKRALDDIAVMGATRPNDVHIGRLNRILKYGPRRPSPRIAAA